MRSGKRKERGNKREHKKRPKKAKTKQKSESFIYNQIRQKRTESDCELRIALYKSDDGDHQYNVQSTPRQFCDNDFFFFLKLN